MTPKMTMNKAPVNRPLNFSGAAAKFWHFNQNNSGGFFVFDHTDGLSCHVIIEAEDLRQAVEIAENIGIYFNGCSTGRDCDCCGDRWSKPYQSDDKPMIYNWDVSSGIYHSSSMWSEDGIEGYIHYLDGRVVPIKLKKISYEEEKRLDAANEQ